MSNTIPLPTDLPANAHKIIHRYLHLRVGHAQVASPYWRNRPNLKGPLGGKGKPEEIEFETKKAAQNHGLQIQFMSGQNILALMKQSSIGVDCSGYAYQVLDAFDKDRGGQGLDTKIIATPGGNPLNELRFRTNADYLTNNANSFPIHSIADIQSGDMIRMEGGKHVAIILSKKDDEIIYTHSSQQVSEISGVHLAKITITDPTKHIADQQWHELTPKGENIAKQFVKADKGDGVFRLKWWK